MQYVINGSWNRNVVADVEIQHLETFTTAKVRNILDEPVKKLSRHITSMPCANSRSVR